MAGHRKRDDGDEERPFPTLQDNCAAIHRRVLTTIPESKEIESQNRSNDKDIGHELASVPRDAVEKSKPHHARHCQRRPAAKVFDTERQDNQPDDERRLCRDVRPKMEWDAEREEIHIDGGLTEPS